MVPTAQTVGPTARNRGWKFYDGAERGFVAVYYTFVQVTLKEELYVDKYADA